MDIKFKPKTKIQNSLQMEIQIITKRQNLNTITT
jgi:hypothetical protein